MYMYNKFNTVTFKHQQKTLDMSSYELDKNDYYLQFSEVISSAHYEAPKSVLCPGLT